MRRPNISLQDWLPSIFGIALFFFALASKSPAQAVPPGEKIVRVPASRFQNHSPESLSVDLRSGIGPDDAAAIALYSNPALRAIRDRRRLAAAQLVQA